MKEANFIKRHRDKWKKIEADLKDANSIAPDDLAHHFTEVTDDLSFAQTYYANGNTHRYLNQLAANIHQKIYNNKKERKERYIDFWLVELPLVFKRAHRQFLFSFLIFGVAVLIGIVSTAHDETFPRLILGDGYVNMTLENIKNNDPMAVYKGGSSTDFFLMISLNNILVAFRAFVMGLLFSFGTVFILIYNGIMVGTFQFFFHQYGLLLDSSLVIWIHGTLEISAIVIAGGAGLMMGNSLLFPGTYPRLTAFKYGVKNGLKIMIGLIPVFLLAAFLEGFVTRLTDMPVALKLLIIGGSLAFILFYFVFLPIRLHKKQGH